VDPERLGDRTRRCRVEAIWAAACSAGQQRPIVAALVREIEALSAQVRVLARLARMAR
jgi:chemotaxis methyl-accepting protein methylase